MHKINYVHCEEWHYIERYHCKMCGSGYKTGVHKSWGPGRPGDYILC